MDQLHNLAMGYIEHMVERASHHSNMGEEESTQLLLTEAENLAKAMNGEEDMLWLRYHRYASDSFGVAFEIDHGDPELMFGGV